MSKYLVSSLLAFSVLMSGCVATYKPPEDTSKTVVLNVNELVNPMICQDNRWHRLVKNKQGQVRVPVGERITVTNNFEKSHYGSAYITTWSCKPKFSFAPQKSYEYYIDYQYKVGDESCNMTLLKRSANSKGKYSFDNTTTPAVSCLRE